VKLEAQVLSRFIAKQFGQSGNIQPRLTSNQSTAAALVEALFMDMSRAGRRFVASPGVVANAQAPVQDVPTTAAAYALWNGEAAGGKTYVVDAVSWWQASGTAGAGASLLAGVSSVVQAAAVAAGTGTVIKSASGSSLSSKATLGAAVTLSGAPAWMAVSGNQEPTTAGVGSGQPLQILSGLFIVPPGFCLGLHFLAPAGTASKFSAAPMWHEIELDLE
jgi:hypothetical protein